MTTLTPLLILTVVLGLLALVLRWAFGSDRRGVPDHTGTDFGLLTEVAVVPTPEAAQVLASRLRRSRIRVTVVNRDHGHRLLVFPADAAEARLVLRDV
ncbi:hypothetical protein [Saccharothrix violaceirubra]|uniref:Uncharacterized protein n=1 Tax=Saccharothrix violaceirubra TaxID=413306 RepID=A0A7W7SZ21_9PSEU|nr:hypothetical protein [Saccharothrix violaceirubra]MBB4963591.1 hypothetical protein [Saccharothrix violaceirubra]